MENKPKTDGSVADGQSMPQKKAYKAPTLREYGEITNLVNRRLVFGTDGGTPVDNDT